MRRVIAIACQKGGTGKTTTAVNLAACLALLERPCLLIDCDPCGAAAANLGVSLPEDAPDVGGVLLGEARLADALLPGPVPGLRLAASRPSMGRLASAFDAIAGTRKRLKEILAASGVDAPFVVIDTPPGVGGFTRLALMAADELVIPVQRRMAALQGLSTLLSAARHARNNGNPGLRVAGMLLTMQRPKKPEPPDAETGPGPAFFPEPVEYDTRVIDAANAGRPVVLTDILSRPARSYFDLTVRLLDQGRAQVPGVMKTAR